MKYMLKVISATVFLIGLALAILFVSQGHFFISIVIGLFSILSALIFWKKDAYAFRFLYPGIITFFLFMILPIVFTVYIAFTNLGTGHYLSFDEAKQSILSQKKIVKDSPILSFDLMQTGSQSYRIDVKYKNEYYMANFSLDQLINEINFQKFSEKSKFKKSNKAEIYSVAEKMHRFNFIFPDRQKFQYYRVKKLAQFNKLFKETKEGLVTLGGTLFSPNDEIGFYQKVNAESGNFEKQKLFPGYYTLLGFRNFSQLFNNKQLSGPFWNILIWTFSWGLFSVMLTFLAGMTLAIVLNDKGLKFKKFYRTLFVLPYSIPFFISVLIFKGMLNKDFGIINSILSNFGITNTIPWLETPFLAKISCLMVNLWLGFPYMFLVTTGILQSIPASLYEAARLDGSSTFNTFKEITLPLIMRAIGPILIGSFAFNINNFIGIYLLTGGGPPVAGSTTPAGSTDILISYTYRLAFEGGQGQNFGLASSISILIFIVISILTFINFKITGFAKEEK